MVEIVYFIFPSLEKRSKILYSPNIKLSKNSNTEAGFKSMS